MIDVNFGEKMYELRNELDEIYLGEWQKVTNILTRENDYYFLNWLDIIEILGSTELKENIDDVSLYSVIKHLNITGDVSNKIVPEFSIGDRKFYTNVNEIGALKMKGIELAEIEVTIKQKPNNWLPKVMAILYKEVGADSSVTDRTKLFEKKMTANIAMPAAYVVNNRLIMHIQTIQKTYSEKA